MHHTDNVLASAQSGTRRGPVASTKFRAPDTVLRKQRNLGEVAGAELAMVGNEQFRISSSMSFIGRTSTHALAARLADWLCGLGDFERDYKSSAVFLQVKLKEMESISGELSTPNPIRTAVALGLFDLFLRRVSQ